MARSKLRVYKETFTRSLRGPTGHSDKWYNALRQSMLLATKLLSVSGAFMASFMPVFIRNTTRKMRACAVPFDDVYPTRAQFEKMTRAQQSLRDSASSLKWREDANIATDKSWAAITAPYNCQPPADKNNDVYDWAGADEEEGIEGTGELRSICISVMSQFADVILASKSGTMDHLLATFNCGVVSSLLLFSH